MNHNCVRLALETSGTRGPIARATAPTWEVPTLDFKITCTRADFGWSWAVFLGYNILSISINLLIPGVVVQVVLVHVLIASIYVLSTALGGVKHHCNMKT